MFYCEIDENGICYHVTQNELPLSERIVLSDIDALGMKYQDGGWEKAAEPAAAEPQLTTEEMLAEVLLSTEYTACLLEEQMENM